MYGSRLVRCGTAGCRSQSTPPAIGLLMTVSSQPYPSSYAALKQPPPPPATRQTHGRMLGTGNGKERGKPDERSGWDRGKNRGKIDRAEADHCRRRIFHRRPHFGLAARGPRRIGLLTWRGGGLHAR